MTRRLDAVAAGRPTGGFPADRCAAGFTLIELAIVVLIMGILFAITVPHYLTFSARAKDAAVRENIHAIQASVEVFAVDHGGTYPLPADQIELRSLMPGGDFPDNPFTNAPTALIWNIDPNSPGEISYSNLPGGGYAMKGHGSSGLLTPFLVVGN